MVLSPITNTNNVELKNEIHSEDILSIYENELGTNVSRFFKHTKVVSLYRCEDTGLYFYYPKEVAGDEEFYNDLKREMPRRFGVPYYPESKWEYDICVELISKNETVYEVGAGNGAFLKKLKAKGVTEIHGAELNLDSINQAFDFGIVIENKTIQDKANEGNSMYDVVCTFQVLEHISEIKSFIKGCLDILKSGGKFIIAVPYNNPYLFKNDKLNALNMPPHHMALWNSESFMNLKKYFPIKLKEVIIEKLPSNGYDFERYFEVNRNYLYPKGFPFKKIFDRMYFKWLKKNHLRIEGKNIIAIYERL